MSGFEEQHSLLANMDENPEVDEDQFRAMHQMMGFSSFGGPQKPKRQPKGPGAGKGFGTGANTQPIQPRSSSISTISSTLTATSHPFIPASLPPRPVKQQKINTTPHTTVHDTTYFQTISPVQATASPSTKSTITEPPTTSAASTLNPNSQVFNPDTNTNANLPPAPSSSAHPTFTNTDNSDLDETAYTSPSGITLTRRELKAYESGVAKSVTDKDGTTSQVKVYFKPNFIDDNPWKGLDAKS